MNLVIVHYHLNRGGVTQVIRNHLRCLRRHRAAVPRIAILFGGRQTAWPEDASRELEVALHTVPSLEYDELAEGQSGDTPDKLAGDVSSLLDAQGLSADDTVLHVHNHSLGKNTRLPLAIAQLARQGYRCLLQIHDFAEDLRPANYQHLRSRLGERLPNDLYPQSPSIHYATLNSRDHGVLTAAGIEEQRLHWLPNPAYAPAIGGNRAAVRRRFAEQLGVSTDDQLLVYPVRAIARKNVGEALLWAAVRAQRSVGITLAPIADRELAGYQRWVDLTSELQLPVHFDLSQSFTFAENVTAADALVSTSVAEGFGMVFLESFLADRMIVGRDLPEITCDFRKAGVQFPGLRESVRIPASCVDAAALVSAWRQLYEAVCGQYDQPAASADGIDRFRALAAGESVDFGLLPARLQRDVLRRVCRDGGLCGELAATLPDPEQCDGCVVGANRSVIEREFGEDAIGDSLASVYNQLLECPTGQPVSPLPTADKILAAFLSPERLIPVRLAETARHPDAD